MPPNTAFSFSFAIVVLRPEGIGPTGLGGWQIPRRHLPGGRALSHAPRRRQAARGQPRRKEGHPAPHQQGRPQPPPGRCGAPLRPRPPGNSLKGIRFRENGGEPYCPACVFPPLLHHQVAAEVVVLRRGPVPQAGPW